MKVYIDFHIRKTRMNFRVNIITETGVHVLILCLVLILTEKAQKHIRHLRNETNSTEQNNCCEVESRSTS
jgi:hypothetical protein